jgi:arginyl-tRNA synthetase
MVIMDANIQPVDVVPSQSGNPRKCIIDTTALPMEEVERRVIPTKYTLSRLRMAVAERLAAIIPDSSAEKLYNLLELPKNAELGHFALPVPQLRLPGNPTVLAFGLAEKLTPDALITKACAERVFLNISVNRMELMNSTVTEALQLDAQYGMNDVGRGKRVAVEYCSCNIAKPFHAGHLRTTIIGNFLKNLFRANGFDTFGINYLGDWGKQYGALAIGFGRYGDEAKLEQDPIRHLFEVYVKIHADMEKDETINEQARSYFLRMEQGDEECLKLWRRFRELSIAKYADVFGRLNVHFEVYSGESLYSELMKIRLSELDNMGLLKESRGAKLVDLEQFSLGKPLLIKSDGATLYLTRDVAAAQDRFDRWKLDKSIYVIAAQQDLHMQQLIKILELANKPFAKRITHINFGMVKGMSTRKGTIVFLDDILDEARETMHGVMRSNPDKYAEVTDPERTSDILGVSAVVVQDMMAKRIKDYDFNMDRMTAFEGDTGPYLQYAHTRLSSIPRRTGISIGSGELQLDLLTEQEAHDLAFLISRYPEVVQEARISCEPCQVVNYLLALARQVSSCLDKLYVMGQEAELARARLALYTAARITLGNGLRLLGLVPLERM